MLGQQIHTFGSLQYLAENLGLRCDFFYVWSRYSFDMYWCVFGTFPHRELIMKKHISSYLRTTFFFNILKHNINCYITFSKYNNPKLVLLKLKKLVRVEKVVCMLTRNIILLIILFTPIALNILIASILSMIFGSFTGLPKRFFLYSKVRYVTVAAGFEVVMIRSS